MEIQPQYFAGAQIFVDDVPGLATAGYGFCGGVLKRRVGGFSGEPESDLTCIAPGPSKKACGGRDRGSWSQSVAVLAEQMRGAVAPASGRLPACFQVSNGEKRLNDSEMASTTGRPHAGSQVPMAIEHVEPAVSEDLVSAIRKHNLEIDAFLRVQNERFRSEMDRMRKRYYRSFLQAYEAGAVRALREKEAELEFISRHNAELEEKLGQLTSDNELWIHIARNNEAAVCYLRARLEHALTARVAFGLASSAAAGDLEEGFGESEFPSPAGTTRNARSSTSYADAEASSKELQCKLCLRSEASVLMLPCRHLCVCVECDLTVHTCPICSSAKDASIQVFMA